MLAFLANIISYCFLLLIIACYYSFLRELAELELAELADELLDPELEEVEVFKTLSGTLVISLSRPTSSLASVL